MRITDGPDAVGVQHLSAALNLAVLINGFAAIDECAAKFVIYMTIFSRLLKNSLSNHFKQRFNSGD